MFKNLFIISLMAILPSSALEYGFSLSGSTYTGQGKITKNFDNKKNLSMVYDRQYK